MYHTDIKSGGHKWQKQNLVTITGRKGSYDLLKCELCGIRAKTTALGHIAISDSYSTEKITKCPGKNPQETYPTRVKVTKCNAYGERFSNLTPGSEHRVVTPPGDYKNDDTGVWVMGVGEPVKLLANEYNAID